ncbi:hypothetical protein L596_011481 [Steinernema carpocapsae]|uniref:Secreted protein n=1 Tax=Steinernema carpocapsae TaxID=34508 RepID=A0A4U5NU18_STECR|nr:hypothetical protein L596_011481 [Steinernema carpocapsae]
MLHIFAMFGSLFVLLGLFSVAHAVGDPMKLMNMKWAEKFEPHSYKPPDGPDLEGDEPLQEQQLKNFGYSDQGIKDLDEVGGLVGGGDSDILGILRPYYSMMEMGANGNRQGIGSYLHVLPDEEEGEKPIYSVGGSFSGGIEPAGVKHGYMSRPFGR